MSTIQLQVPNWLQESLHQVAAQQDCSINLFIMLAVTEKLTVLTSKEYQEYFKKFQPTHGGQLLKPAQPIVDRTKFETLLDKVANVEPPEWDKLP